MSDFESKTTELTQRAVNYLSKMEKEKDVRDIIMEHANMPRGSGKTNLEAVLESFTNLAIDADSEQVRSQTATQYIKFLAKPVDEENSSKTPLNLQININPVKGEKIVE